MNVLAEIAPPAPPSNLEAEQELLGAIMVSNTQADKVAFLRPEHFAEAIHGRIYSAMLTMLDRGDAVTGVTLRRYFERDAGLDDIGGTSYLARLAAACTAPFMAADYARAVFDAAQRRQVIATAQDLMAAANDGATDIKAALDASLGDLDAIGGGRDTERGKLRPIGEAIDLALQQVSEAAKSDGRLVGITTGLTDLDRLSGGLRRGTMTVLAGRPSMGKSALAVSIARAAARAGHGAAIESLEDSREALALRLISDPLDIAYTDMLAGRIDGSGITRAVGAGATLRALPLYAGDPSAPTIAAIRSDVRRLKRDMAKRGERLELVVVDYLQLATPSGSYRGNKVHEVTEISAGLKSLAKDLDVAVLALSQLSRQVESRDDKRPQLSDLRDSGSIEQDADVVLFVYREEYYLARAEPRSPNKQAEWDEAMARAKNVVEIGIAKQRNGPVGVVRAYFNPAMNRFRDLSQ